MCWVGIIKMGLRYLQCRWGNVEFEISQQLLSCFERDVASHPGFGRPEHVVVAVGRLVDQHVC